jgi:hypothetical protein
VYRILLQYPGALSRILRLVPERKHHHPTRPNAAGRLLPGVHDLTDL